MILNGQIPVAQLVKVDATHYASPGCARAWHAFSTEMGGLTVGNAADAAYRSLAWQKYRWNLHQNHPQDTPVAAYPGTSNHGWGQAIDIGNYYLFAHSTLVHVGRKHGFEFDTPSEGWHIRFTGSAAYASSIPAPALETIMALNDYEYIWTKDKGVEYALLSPTNLPDGYLRSTVVGEAEEWNNATHLTATRKLTRKAFDQAIAGAKKLRDLYEIAR